LQEKELKKKYGYKNKKEIWRFSAMLRGFRQQAREIFASDSLQKKKEGENLIKKIYNIGLLSEKATFDEILGLTIDDISKRRLVSFVVSKGFARTPSQARQFITHKHILVNGKKVNAPNYIVLRKEENNIEFADNSVLNNPKHALIESMNNIAKDSKQVKEEQIVKKLKEDSKIDIKKESKKVEVEEKK
jgi:small subunit ribosomal protein S4